MSRLIELLKSAHGQCRPLCHHLRFCGLGGTINLSGNATQAAGQRTNLTVAVMG